MKLIHLVLSASILCAPASLAADGGQDCSQPGCDTKTENQDLRYKFIDMPLQSVFSTIQSETGQRIVASPEIRGRLSKISLSGSVKDIISEIASTKGLDWFTYDGAYYVSRSDDAVTRLIALDGLSDQIAMGSLLDSGLASDSVQVNTVAGGKALSVSGPPEYLALAEAIILVTDAPATEAAGRSVIRVRRGTTTSLEYYGEAGMVAANQSDRSDAVEPPVAATADTEQQQDGDAADG